MSSELITTPIVRQPKLASLTSMVTNSSAPNLGAANISNSWLGCNVNADEVADSVLADIYVTALGVPVPPVPTLFGTIGLPLLSLSRAPCQLICSGHSSCV